MISQTSFEAVTALAKLAAENDTTILAQENTPLHELYKTTSLMGETPITTSTALGDPTAVGELATAASTQSNNSAHNERFDYFVANIADAVNQHFAFAKNTVTATIERITVAVMKDLNGKQVNPISDFEIVIKELPIPMQQTSFFESVTRLAGGMYIEPRGTFTFGVKGPQEIMELMFTGSASFDEQVRLWCARIGDSFLVNIWENHFRSPMTANVEKPIGFMESISHPDTGIDAAAVVHLITRKLKEEVPEDSGMSLSAFNDLCQEYIEVTATSLVRYMEASERNVKNALLVLGRDTMRKRVTVSGPVYKNWIKTGGKNETLFGMLVSGEVHNTVESIDKIAPKCIDAWTRYVSLANTKFRNELFNRFIESLRTSFFVDMKNLEGAEKELLEQNSQYVTTIAKILEEELEKVSTSDQNDIVRTVCRLVCKARYFYTDSYKILCTIDEATTANKELAVEDAVAIARIEYVCDFISSQMKILR